MRKNLISLNRLFELSSRTVLGYMVFFLSFVSVPFFKNTWDKVSGFEDLVGINSNYVVIGNAQLKVKIVDDDSKRKKGLGGIESLDDDKGMLFVFDESGYYGIWMKDMNFPIDIIWLNEAHQVADYQENVSPDTYPKVFKPLVEAKYVLETNAGFIKKEGIKIGDEMTIF